MLPRRASEGATRSTQRAVQARGSRNRDRMFAEQGRFQVPFLRDPNTGVELFESAEIVAYLNEVYTS